MQTVLWMDIEVIMAMFAVACVLFYYSEWR
jgi:hypothetical protein